jgi:hypothetical protein
MIDTTNLLSIAIEAGALIATLAAIAAAVIMLRVTKKFGTGILASGFKSISFGVLFIALGIFADAVQNYLQTGASTIPIIQQIVTTILFVKLILYVIGTYIIVIGSKRTGDNLESLMK